MRNLLFLIGLIMLFISNANAQQVNPWTARTSSVGLVKARAVSRLSFPQEYNLYNLELGVLRKQLFNAVGKKRPSVVTIIIPNADNGMEVFEILEASNFDPELQAKFPEIRAFSGKGITDPYATLKLSYSPQGIQAMVFRTDKENEFIEPFSNDNKVYAVFKSLRKPGDLPWTCGTPVQSLENGLNNKVNQNIIKLRSGGDLKTFRLAQSVTAEYSNYFGATSSTQSNLVLAAVNNTLTRCNGVYERDLAIHLNLIANTTSVFYYNPSTDPYSAASTGSGGAWNNELQTTLTNVIGEANYDIGHLFGASGGGGNAGCIGCICVNGSKGKGFTSPADGIPQGDNFDIDYVVHEVGHQLGANHTFSMSNEGTGVNKEPGSGITIMGYAGITSQDLAPHSIDMYHAASIGQIQTNLATKTCAVTTSIAAINATPVVAALTNYTIPISTPFALTGSATDANNDPLTYCWEQNDNAAKSQTGTSSVASATKASGPNWISYTPSNSPTRLFPKLSTILAGQLISDPLTGGDPGANTEALSSVSRTLNFRLTVRDNSPYSSTAPVKVGQTQFADMVVTVSNTSGPFQVTAPNTAVSWVGGSTQTITWNVANTTATPVSCTNVKISLSTDGGQTFPIVLLSTTPNDGSQAVVIPNTPTSTARIKIESVGNIFFDISNANFTITTGSSCGTPTGLTASSITTSSAMVSWIAVSGAQNHAVDYKLNSSSTWISAATATTATSLNLTGLNSGALYDWRVTATCSTATSAAASAQFTTTSTAVCNAPSGLTASSITSISATVSWTAVSGAQSYAVDYKLNSSATWISAATMTTATSVNLTGLNASSLYDYRVSTNCGTNGTSGFSSAQFTTTAASTCATAFEPNESIAAAAAITIGSTNSAAITTTTDNDYFKITTTSVSDITYNLVGPSGVDYDLTIFNSAGTQIGSAATTSSTETVTLTNQATGTYYIRVFGFNGANSASCYTIRATAVTGCRSTLDNTTNNAASGAATIPFNTNVTGQIEASNDVDHYKFVITTGGTITLSLTTLPANYNLRLVNNAGTILATSANTGTTNETINSTVSAGTYYARVYTSSSTIFNAASCYTLKVQLGTASRLDNLITNSNSEGITTYPNPVRNILNIDLSGYEGSTQINLFTISGLLLKSKTTNKQFESFDVFDMPAGIYMLKISNGRKETAVAKFIKN
jgi:hypothetical protein